MTTCEICGKELQSASQLRVHRRSRACREAAAKGLAEIQEAPVQSEPAETQPDSLEGAPSFEDALEEIQAAYARLGLEFTSQDRQNIIRHPDDRIGAARNMIQMKLQCLAAAPSRSGVDPVQHARESMLLAERERREQVRLSQRINYLVGSTRPSGGWEHLAARAHRAASEHRVSPSAVAELIDIDPDALEAENRRLGTPDAQSMWKVA